MDTKNMKEEHILGLPRTRYNSLKEKTLAILEAAKNKDRTTEDALLEIYRTAGAELPEEFFAIGCIAARTITQEQELPQIEVHVVKLPGHHHHEMKGKKAD